MADDVAYNDEPKMNGRTIAILVNDGFEQVELTGPREALERAGAITHIVSGKKGKVQGFNHDEKADQFDVAKTFDEADASAYDAILLPGGALNADDIRMSDGARKIVRDADREGKPIAVICHGPWLLVSAGLVQGRTLTSWPTLQDDIRNAGGNWVDQEVVVDGNLISSRKPDDIPAFNRTLIETLTRQTRESTSGTADEVTNGMSG
jgi:protease I